MSEMPAGLHLSMEQVQGYAARALSPAELLAVDNHCAACHKCRQRLAEAAGISAAYAGLVRKLQAGEEMEHVEYEQMQSFVDGSLGEIDREIMDAHLEACPRCNDEVNDLLAFKLSMRRAETSPAKTFTVPRTVLKAPLTPMLLRLAGIAAALVICVWIAVTPLRVRISELGAQLGQARSENETLRRQVASLEDRARNLQAGPGKAQGTSGMVAIRDGGGELALDAGQHLVGAELMPPQYRQMVQQALLTQDLETPPDLDKVLGRTGTLMGGGGSVPFRLLRPVATAVVSDRPVFEWAALSGADGYRVGISDTDFNEIESSSVLKETTWAPTRPLKRGRVYIWQVTALVHDREVRSPMPPAPEARFIVLDSNTAAEMTVARQGYGQSRLLMGILCARFGLMDEAESEFEELLKANPKSHEVEQLLKNIRAVRGS